MGKGYEFVDKITGGRIPREYIPAVDQGAKESMTSGVLAGYPMVDIKVELIDGKYHDVDSSEMAFKIAGIQAFKEAARKAKPVILEPIMAVEVHIPEQYMGEVNRDLNGRRGRVLGMDLVDGTQLINAHVPQAELFSYATELRSLTGGRGTFSAQLDHYEDVPSHLAEKIIETHRKDHHPEGH